MEEKKTQRQKFFEGVINNSKAFAAHMQAAESLHIEKEIYDNIIQGNNFTTSCESAKVAKIDKKEMKIIELTAENLALKKEMVKICKTNKILHSDKIILEGQIYTLTSRLNFLRTTHTRTLLTKNKEKLAVIIIEALTHRGMSKAEADNILTMVTKGEE